MGVPRKKSPSNYRASFSLCNVAVKKAQTRERGAKIWPLLAGEKGFIADDVNR